MSKRKMHQNHLPLSPEGARLYHEVWRDALHRAESASEVFALCRVWAETLGEELPLPAKPAPIEALFVDDWGPSNSESLFADLAECVGIRAPTTARGDG